MMMILIRIAIFRSYIFWKIVLEHKTTYQEDRVFICLLNNGLIFILCLLLTGTMLSNGWVKWSRLPIASVQVQQRTTWAHECNEIQEALCAWKAIWVEHSEFWLWVRGCWQWCCLSGVWRETQKSTKMDGEMCIGVDTESGWA